MTKYVDFTWKVPVPQELLDGTVADKWVEEKDSADLEHEAFFRSVKCFSFHDQAKLDEVLINEAFF